jgi:hypothetical protein
MSKLSEVLAKMSKDYLDAIKRQIVIEKLNASGDLVRSIREEVTSDGFSISSEAVNAYLLTDKGYKPKKAGTREEKKQKLERIKNWMKSKGIRPYTRLSSGGVKFKKLKNPEKQYDQAAFFINRSMNRKGSIKRYGYKGSDILQTVYDMQSKKSEEEITMAIRQDIIDGIKADIKLNNIKIQ